MRQKTIDKWISIFKQYKPGMKVSRFCEQIGVSRGYFYSMRRYFMQQPELVEYIQHDSIECEAEETVNNGEAFHDDQSSADNNKDEEELEGASELIPLMVVPEDMSSCHCGGAANHMKAASGTCPGLDIEISVGTVRLRCSTAIPEADLAKLVRVCASV